MCDEDKTSNSVHACSDLAHVVLVLVGVRRVTVVIVHIGLEGVLVVIHFCVAILFVNCCIKRCSLYTILVGKAAEHTEPSSRVWSQTKGKSMSLSENCGESTSSSRGKAGRGMRSADRSPTTTWTSP